MGYTDVTPRLKLPQYIGTDKPSWLTDFNTAMSILDDSYGQARESAEQAQDLVANYGQMIQDIQTNITEIADTLDCVKTTTQNNVADINTINEKIAEILSGLAVQRRSPVLSGEMAGGVAYVSWNGHAVNLQAALNVKASYNQTAFDKECGLWLFSVSGNPFGAEAQQPPVGFVLAGMGWVGNTPYDVGYIYTGDQTQFYITWPSDQQGPPANSFVAIESTWLV